MIARVLAPGRSTRPRRTVGLAARPAVGQPPGPLRLRVAYDSFGDMGAKAFAERARQELVATGATARRRQVDTRDLLTAQEAQIAQLAADGLTNHEIGSQLFLSHHTVEWHLRNVFTKLGIRSRRELAIALPRCDS